MPAEYARGAIEAAAELVADPNHATWAEQHWGEHYLEKENLFYRMLLISALTSYQKLLDDDRYEDLLRGQVDSLAKELDQSPYGLLDDYPGQCYPVDIVPAIAAIRRADEVLGTDHSEFAARAIRGFEGTRLDSDSGLPAYVVDSRTGQARDSARGVGLSFMLIWAPELWPDRAAHWYDLYERQFWQQGRLLAGFREFPTWINVGWFAMDVDAGPVIGGYGVAATAFGVGAARVQGRFDHAYPLSAQALAASWPLADGTLLGPRILSNVSDAPYLGEAATLFALSRRPAYGEHVTETGPLPYSVYIVILAFLALGCYETTSAVLSVRRWHRQSGQARIWAPLRQFQIWLGLMLGAIAGWFLFSKVIGLVLLLSAQMLPRYRRQQKVSTKHKSEQGR